MRTSVFLTALLLMPVVLFTQRSDAGKTPGSTGRRFPMLVSAPWMAEHMRDTSVIVIHVAQNRREYTNGHIPGARFLWAQALTYTNPDLAVELPSLVQADSTLRNLGISDHTSIVLYFAEANITPAARVYLTLDYLGLADRVSLLDGGLDAWKRSGNPVSTEPVSSPRGTCALHPKEVTVDWQWVRDNLDNPKISIVDARTAQFFAGKGGGMPRPGHIPKAVNIPYSSVVDSTNSIKDIATLRRVFETAGIKQGTMVVSYCHIGQQASLVYFVARYLGHDARLYDGSFEDWSGRIDVPVIGPAATVPLALATSQNSRPGDDTTRFVWKRYPGNPVFPAVAGTWYDVQSANPDLLLNGETYFMYFRGQRGGHDRLGVATISKEKFDGVTWNIHPEPIIDVGEPGSWDERHALDPAAILAKGRVFLYYTGSSPKADRAICLAVSDDGIHFKKYEKNPVVIGGGPEVVFRDSIFYLYFWKQVPGKKGFQIHYATSTDGFHYAEAEPARSLALPVGPEGTWDSFTVETQRVFSEGGLYYMVYCGSDRNKDYPFNAGLATSRDLIHWTKYPGNPIFSRGEEGQWDEGAIWFTTVEKINGRYYMWYEGYGGGTARTEPYGSYLKGGKSQVGMATMDAPYFYVRPDIMR